MNNVAVALLLQEKQNKHTLLILIWATWKTIQHFPVGKVQTHSSGTLIEK